MPLTDIEKEVLAQTRSQLYGLTAGQRTYLRFFFGFTRGEEGREKTRNKADASSFVQKTIFEPGHDDDEIFSFDRHINLKACSSFPSVTNTDEQSIKQFLSRGGLGLSDRQQIGLIRALTSFNSVFPTDMYLNRGEKALTGFIAGKVSRR